MSINENTKLYLVLDWVIRKNVKDSLKTIGQQQQKTELEHVGDVKKKSRHKHTRARVVVAVPYLDQTLVFYSIATSTNHVGLECFVGCEAPATWNAIVLRPVPKECRTK